MITLVKKKISWISKRFFSLYVPIILYMYRLESAHYHNMIKANIIMYREIKCNCTSNQYNWKIHSNVNFCWQFMDNVKNIDVNYIYIYIPISKTLLLSFSPLKFKNAEN